MAILVDGDTRLCVAGVTGREGQFHALNNRRYGTDLVAGVTPGKGGQDVEGRKLLADANLPNVHPESTMLGAAEKVVELARAGASA